MFFFKAPTVHNSKQVYLRMRTETKGRASSPATVLKIIAARKQKYCLHLHSCLSHDRMGKIKAEGVPLGVVRV